MTDDTATLTTDHLEIRACMASQEAHDARPGGADNPPRIAVGTAVGIERTTSSHVPRHYSKKPQNLGDICWCAAAP